MDAYINIASKAKNPISAYQKAILLNKSKNSIKKILAGIGQFGDVDAIGVIEPYLNNKDTQDEAASALTTIARKYKVLMVQQLSKS